MLEKLKKAVCIELVRKDTPFEVLKNRNINRWRNIFLLN